MLLIKFYGRKWKALRISLRSFHRETLYSWAYPQSTFQIPGFSSACEDSGCPIVGLKTRSSPLKLRGKWMMKKMSVSSILWLPGYISDNIPVTPISDCPNTWTSSLWSHSFFCVLTLAVLERPGQEGRGGEAADNAPFPDSHVLSDHDPKAWTVKQRWIYFARGSNSW